MKLLMISGMDTVYGASRSFIGLIRQLYARGYILTIITPRECRANDYCNKYGIDNFVIPYSSSCGNTNFVRIKRVAKDINNFFCYMILCKHLLDADFDAVYSNDIDSVFGSYLASKLKVEHIWHIRSFGQEDYGTFYHYPIKEYLNSANKCIAISYIVYLSWLKKGVRENKLITIYNGVEVSSIQPRLRTGKEEMLNILMIGNITTTKGQYLLLDAYALLDERIRENTIIDFYGNASENDFNYLCEMKERCQKSNLINVNFKGFSENMYDLLQYYDVGVMCSKSEAFGRVTVEYMAAGLCVIASDSGANPEIIKSGYNGLLFERENAEDLAERIRYIYLNRSIIAKYGEVARNIALSEFTVEKNGYLVDQLIRNVCSQKRSS